MGKEKGMLHGILIKVDGGVLNGSQGVRGSTWWVILVGYGFKKILWWAQTNLGVLQGILIKVD